MEFGGLKRGFVFSLDAFVAFSLILIAIQSFVVISSAPSGYYLSLKQANYLAQDTLNSVLEMKINNGQATLLDDVGTDAFKPKLANGKPNIGAYSVQKTQQLILKTLDLIPAPYSFSYDFYDFGDPSCKSNPESCWHQIYNASDPANPPAFTRPRFLGTEFHRVMASSQLMMGVYSVSKVVGTSPYCNVACHGFDPTTGQERLPEQCTQTPCEPMTGSTFQTGDFNVGLLRLTVWG